MIFGLRRPLLPRVMLALCFAPLALHAQTTRRITGFGLSYSSPAGWTTAGADGRAEAWSRSGTVGALIVYGGTYSAESLAIADGGTMMQDAQFRGPGTVLEPLAQRRVAGVDVWTTAVRVQAASGDAFILRALVRSAGNGTMLGVITLAPPAADTTFRAAAEQLLASVRAGTPVVDRPATTALVGSWRWQESNMSSNGGYVNEEGWDFAPDGSFVHWTTSTVSLPGAAAEPTRTRQTGRWEVMGGALVVRASDGIMTLSLKQLERRADIAGRRFLRR